MRISRTRSGYALVLLALAVMGIMASQAQTQGTTEMYELSLVNQYATDIQLRWFAEGLLNLQTANCSTANDATLGGVNGVRAPDFWFTAGMMYARSGSTSFNITTVNNAEPSGRRRMVGIVDWINNVGATPIFARRSVGRRQMAWTGGAAQPLFNFSELGFYVRNEPTQF